MDFRQKTITIMLLCLIGIPIVSALNICDNDLGLELQDGSLNGEFLGEGLYSFEYGNETIIIKVNNCIDCIAENSCDNINNSLWSCGEYGNERCDEEWLSCLSDLDTKENDLITCEGEKTECGLELEEEFNESEYYKEKWEDCIDEKRQYEECGEDEDEDCRDLWEDCFEDIEDFKNERDEAEDALNECGDDVDENCKDLWYECDDDYRNCKSTRDEYKSDYNTKADEVNICKRDKDRLQSSYDTCLTEDCPAAKSTPCPAEKTCVDCSSMLESFKTSIKYDTITGGCGGIAPQTPQECECEEEECKNSLIAWIIATIMTVLTAFILISNIKNLSKIKKSGSGGQKPPGLPQQQQQQEGVFDQFK